MDRLVYTALSGMRRSQFAQGVTANNLANAGTVGFRRDTGAFQSRWLDAGGEYGSRVQASEQALATDIQAGVVTATGRPLDLAITGDAMLVVQSPGGGEAYTRRADLRVGASGALETGDGRLVMGGQGPITLPPVDQIAIGADGTISIHPAGQPGAEMVVVDRLKLVLFDAGGMRKEADGLFRRADAADTPAEEGARVQPGALEMSNVSPVASLVELIEQSRAFELSTKLVTTARELDLASTQLMRLE